MSSTHQTVAEAKAELIKLMGSELGSLYSELWQQVAWLHMKWAEYAELFGTKPSRITLLNDTAPFFFRVVQETIWNDVLLHISRLTDPPKSRGKTNLSITRLPGVINEQVTSDKVQQLCDKAVTAARFCRDWRNRHIAHRDLDLALDQGAQPLMPASRDDVKNALSALVAVLDAVSLRYQGSTTAFGLGIPLRGAGELLFVLDDGLKAERARHQAPENGEFNAKDFQRSDL